MMMRQGGQTNRQAGGTRKPVKSDEMARKMIYIFLIMGERTFNAYECNLK